MSWSHIEWTRMLSGIPGLELNLMDQAKLCVHVWGGGGGGISTLVDTWGRSLSSSSPALRHTTHPGWLNYTWVSVQSSGMHNHSSYRGSQETFQILPSLPHSILSIHSFVHSFNCHQLTTSPGQMPCQALGMKHWTDTTCLCIAGRWAVCSTRDVGSQRTAGHSVESWVQSGSGRMGPLS